MLYHSFICGNSGILNSTFEKTYTFPGHLQHFLDSAYFNLTTGSVERDLCKYAPPRDHNYCNRVIYKSVISIIVCCRELYNSKNYSGGVLS